MTTLKKNELFNNDKKQGKASRKSVNIKMISHTSWIEFRPEDSLSPFREGKVEEQKILFNRDRFGQIPRTIHLKNRAKITALRPQLMWIPQPTYIIISKNCDMVREKLQRNDSEDAMKTIHGLWHFDAFWRITLHHRIVFVAYDDRIALWRHVHNPCLVICKKPHWSNMFIDQKSHFVSEKRYGQGITENTYTSCFYFVYSVHRFL